MKNIFVVILVLTVSTCFGQKELKKLKKAYKDKSQSQLESFLQQWQSESKPLASLDSLSDLHKDVYQIYKDFYNPFNLSRVGSGEWGDSLYAGIDYVIIQNQLVINWYKTDTLNFWRHTNTDSLIMSKETVSNFRPDITFEQAKTLYLFPQYSKMINKFLGSKSYPLGFGGIMNPSRAKGESEERLDFLNEKLMIIHGHWGGYWHIATHPYVYSIEFNKDRTIATVNFRLGYQGGSATYIKKDGKWEMKQAGLTWIE